MARCEVAEDLRIIPAYAGSTVGQAHVQSRRADHPRIRGEHFLSHPFSVSSTGSSPHTRGAREHDVLLPARLGIIPAYAGSTSARWERSFSTKDHPRIRGEHAALASQAHSIAGSSPHTRGAPRGRLRHRRHPGIIPAYAGSTCGANRWCTRRRDHPRIRGEHISCSRFVPAIMGSSPHTRGALLDDPQQPWRPGIIPAYAGSTKGLSRALSPPWDHPRIRGEHRALSPPCW